MDGTRVSVRPLWVRMQGENRPFSAGTTYEISCEVVGARPTPKITWSKGSMILRNARQTVRSTEFQVRHSENNCSEKSRIKRKIQFPLHLFSTFEKDFGKLASSFTLFDQNSRCIFLHAKKRSTKLSTKSNSRPSRFNYAVRKKERISLSLCGDLFRGQYFASGRAISPRKSNHAKSLAFALSLSIYTYTQPFSLSSLTLRFSVTLLSVVSRSPLKFDVSVDSP